MIRLIKDKGLGVVADQDYKEGDLVELCETIFIEDPLEVKIISRSPTIKKYYFSLFKEKDTVAIALGNGSLYNHSSKNPNMIMQQLVMNREGPGAQERRVRILFSTNKVVREGEELTFDYTGEGQSIIDFKEL